MEVSLKGKSLSGCRKTPNFAYIINGHQMVLLCPRELKFCREGGLASCFECVAFAKAPDFSKEGMATLRKGFLNKIGGFI